MTAPTAKTGSEVMDFSGLAIKCSQIQTPTGAVMLGAQPATIAALTDSTTGAAGATLAAGVGVRTLAVPHTFIGGTSAVEPMTNFTPGFKFKILSWNFVTHVALAGASGSRVANLEIGTTDVGTTPSTCTIPIANTAVGTVTAATTVTGANTGTASDTISIEIASGGTAFTAGSGTFYITLQNMDEADAAASMTAKITALTTALKDAGVIAAS